MSKLSEARRRIEVMGMAEAQEELKKQRRQLFDLRMQLARGEVKNNRQFPQIRADIARLMYHISELNREARKELARARQAGAQPAEVEAELEAPAAPETAPAKPARRTRATAPKAEASAAEASAAGASAATSEAATTEAETSATSATSADSADEVDEAEAVEADEPEATDEQDSETK